MVQTYQDSREEGTAKPISHQETEKFCHESSDPEKVLQLHHREHSLGCITAWYGNCSTSDRKAIQRVLHTAQYITVAKLPATQDLYTMQCQRKSKKLSKTPATLVIDCSIDYLHYPTPYFTLLLLSVYYLCIVTLFTRPTCTYYLNYLN